LPNQDATPDETTPVEGEPRPELAVTTPTEVFEGLETPALRNELSDVSAYGTNQRDYLREDFWLIVVTEGNADETEIADTSDWCGQGDQGHPPGNA
jgi:hypothetical protein